MKKFKTILVAAAMVAMSCVASAQTVDTKGLSESQKAELILQAAKMKEAATKEPIKVAENVSKANDVALDIGKKWAGVGKELALGIVATAKELGIAANDFAGTPLGRIATAMIVWNYAGKSIVHFLMGAMFLFPGLPLVYWFWRKAIVRHVEYEEKTGIFGRKYRDVKSVQYRVEEGFFLPTLVALIMTGICVAVGTNLILTM